MPTATIPDAIDDDTFDELAAEEERLNAALENPQTIRTGRQTALLRQTPTQYSRQNKTYSLVTQIVGVAQMKR